MGISKRVWQCVCLLSKFIKDQLLSGVWHLLHFPLRDFIKNLSRCKASRKHDDYQKFKKKKIQKLNITFVCFSPRKSERSHVCKVSNVCRRLDRVMFNLCEENAGNSWIQRVIVIYLNYKPRCPKLGQSAGQDLGPVGFANRFLYPG